MSKTFEITVRKAGTRLAQTSSGYASWIRTFLQSLPRQIALSLLTLAVVPQPELAKDPPSSGRTPETVKVWHARYVAGTIKVENRGETMPLPEESRVRVRFEEDRILVFKKKRLVSIPAATVSELDYRAEVFSRSRKVFGKEGFSQSVANCAAGDPQAGAACLLMALPLYAATAPFHYREHFVHITWRAGASTSDEYDDTEQEMELRLGKGEFRGLIAQLERATGKKCDLIEAKRSAKPGRSILESALQAQRDASSIERLTHEQ